MNRYESNIKKAAEHARRARVALQKLNQEGMQYDMVNHPDSSPLDSLIKNANEMGKIYYQEK